MAITCGQPQNWFRKIWGVPRVFGYNPNVTLKNGVVFQSGFRSQVTGHVEYFYNGTDGHSARRYYEWEKNLKTELWKCGIK